MVALLQMFVAEMEIANPLKTKATAGARIKTDKMDAGTVRIRTLKDSN
jgi:hypothetical protein